MLGIKLNVVEEFLHLQLVLLGDRQVSSNLWSGNIDNGLVWLSIMTVELAEIFSMDEK